MTEHSDNSLENTVPKKVRGTFFVEFEPYDISALGDFHSRYDIFSQFDGPFNISLMSLRRRSQPITQKEMNEVLDKYVKGETVMQNYDGRTGHPKGFTWLMVLEANDGEEQLAKNEFGQIAHQVAYEVGGLIVKGPFCNVGWYYPHNGSNKYLST